MKVSVQNNIFAWGIDKSTPLIIGVSGGPDSLALLHYLFIEGFNVIAVHIDHKLRVDSGSDAKFVQEFCQDREIKYQSASVDTLGYVAENGLSIEEAARKLRYRTLFRIAREENALAVIVAHNADDQVETVLMHLLRGSGLEGLRGMNGFTINPEWDSEIPVIRPFLSVWRKEISTYCDDNGLIPVQDQTNLDNRYFRNKIRNELILYLNDYNPNVKNSLFQMSEIISSDFEIILKSIDEAWNSTVVSVLFDCVAFDREKLVSVPKALQNHLFRKAIKHIRSGLRNIGFNTMRIITNSLDSKEVGENIDLINNLSLTFTEDIVFIHDLDHKFEITHGLQLIEEEFRIFKEGVYVISPSYNLTVLPIANRPDLMAEVKSNRDPNIAYINADDIGDLFLRKMSKGDRFLPLGLGGHIKISDYFINQKVPRRERENWPILYSNNEIIWVVGYQIDDKYQINKETQEILKISINKEEHEN